MALAIAMALAVIGVYADVRPRYMDGLANQSVVADSCTMLGLGKGRLPDAGERYDDGAWAI